MNEEKRLAVTVHQIDEEVSVVPRSAFIKSPHGLVQMNRSFGGNIDYSATCCVSLQSVNICSGMQLTLKCFIKNGYNGTYFM